MNWTWFLFGFEGRINRAKYWLAGLVLLGWMIFIIWMVVLATMLLAAAGLLQIAPTTFHFGIEEIFNLADPSFYRSLSPADLVSAFGCGIGMPVFVWIYFATSIKRLHDRDKSGWWMVPYFVLPGLVTQFSGRLDNPAVVGLLGLVAGIFYLWGGIELYFLRGSARTNRFGANPLPKMQNRARSAHASSRGMAAWGQHNELEFVPRKGSPPPL